MRTVKIVNIDIKWHAHSHEHECETQVYCHVGDHRHDIEHPRGDVTAPEGVRNVGALPASLPDEQG